MSIEWLLTKTAGTDTQRKQSTKSDKEDKLPSKICSSKSIAQNPTAAESDKEQLRRVEFLLNANMQNPKSEINLHCSCGHTGTVSQTKTDFKLLRIDKNSFAYFECPKCKRHLRFDSSADTIKIKKGFWGILFGTFS